MEFLLLRLLTGKEASRLLQEARASAARRSGLVYASENLVSGDGVIVGSIFGIAATNAVVGQEFEICVEGEQGRWRIAWHDQDRRGGRSGIDR
jgi:hypothetical protein